MSLALIFEIMFEMTETFQRKKGNFRHKKTVILLYFQTKCICSIYLSISIVCIFSLSPKIIPKEEENTNDNNNNKNYKNIAKKIQKKH